MDKTHALLKQFNDKVDVYRVTNEVGSNEFVISQQLYYLDMSLPFVTGAQIKQLIKDMSEILNPNNETVMIDDENRIVTIGSKSWSYEDFLLLIFEVL